MYIERERYIHIHMYIHGFHSPEGTPSKAERDSVAARKQESMYVYLSLSLYIYIYIHMCIHIYIYIYTHTHVC